MMSNLTKVERRVRFVTGSLIWLMYLTGSITGGLSHVLAVLGAVFIATAVMNFCPYYLMYDLSIGKNPQVR